MYACQTPSRGTGSGRCRLLVKPSGFVCVHEKAGQETKRSARVKWKALGYATRLTIAPLNLSSRRIVAVARRLDDRASDVVTSDRVALELEGGLAANGLPRKVSKDIERYLAVRAWSALHQIEVRLLVVTLVL